MAMHTSTFTIYDSRFTTGQIETLRKWFDFAGIAMLITGMTAPEPTRDKTQAKRLWRYDERRIRILLLLLLVASAIYHVFLSFSALNSAVQGYNEIMAGDKIALQKLRKLLMQTTIPERKAYLAKVMDKYIAMSIEADQNTYESLRSARFVSNASCAVMGSLNLVLAALLLHQWRKERAKGVLP